MNRVVITGIGAVTPIGLNKFEFFEGLKSGRNGIGPISLFEASSFPVRFAGEVKNFGPGDKLFIDFIKKYPELSAIEDRKAVLGFKAALEAIEDSGLGGAIADAGLDFGVSLEAVPLGLIASIVIEKSAGVKIQMPLDCLNKLLIERFGFTGPSFTNCSACAASTQSIGHAFQIIRSGRASVMIAGGHDSMINPLGVGGFALLGALSARNDSPETASRPFDATRDGVVLGEGSAMLVLEEAGRAVKRGARIYAEIAGYGSSFDAYKATDPHPEGEGAALAMRRAIDDAGVELREIDYINAHGTSTPKNDEAETRAIKKVFGPLAYDIAVSSVKSMTGHLIGAAGAVETVSMVFALYEGIIPPTINYREKDRNCDLNYTPNAAAEFGGKCALKNSFGFGGQNACLVVKKFIK
ncbi:MAG: 3-oxoacyl-(acyl-carrier-protein) synthase 2 [bacterium ADurb.Bin243]|nr:MAG: 3-oxoacyl-(acyl-carrier-protein) synthase 2 [bacterium ADurb.Bin243]